MTLQMMQEFGAEIGVKENTIYIPPQEYDPIEYVVESDWSAATYWYEILSLVGKGEVFLNGLLPNSYQGDSKVADLFEQLGIHTTYMSGGVLLQSTAVNAESMEFDFTDQPDLAQTMIVTCCLKGIPFIFSGLQSLKIKETDRIAALKNELRKLGFILNEPGEGQLVWDGEICNPAENIIIQTYDDHRMAMAFTPAAIFYQIMIEDPEVVSKSYPNFWKDIEKITS
jgi:3-phosphoshikimate 1-carboxyvinyltransferase